MSALQASSRKPKMLIIISKFVILLEQTHKAYAKLNNISYKHSTIRRQMKSDQPSFYTLNKESNPQDQWLFFKVPSKITYNHFFFLINKEQYIDQKRESIQDVYKRDPEGPTKKRYKERRAKQTIAKRKPHPRHSHRTNIRAI